MAVSEQEKTIPPFVAFRYEVVLNIESPPEGVTNPVCDGAFSECRGLDMSMEPKKIPNMGSNNEQFYGLTPVTYSNLVLKRGMTSNLHIWQWFVAATTPGKDFRAKGTITLMNADGKPSVIFDVEDCLPTKITGPTLNAQTGQIALEELTLVYRKLTILPPGQASSGSSENSNGNDNPKVSGGPGLGGSF